MGATLATVRMRAAATVTRPDGTVVPDPPSRWPPYLALVEKDPDVARVLDIIRRSEQPGWVDLYKVHEIIRRDIEPKKIYQIGWATKTQDSAFTASADRYDVSGDYARHAVDKRSEPPTHTMTSSEGWSYISGLAMKWLHSLTETDD